MKKSIFIFSHFKNVANDLLKYYSERKREGTILTCSLKCYFVGP